MASKTNKGVFVRVPDSVKEEIDLYAQKMDVSITSFTSMMAIIGLEQWKKAVSSDTDLKTIAEILLGK